MASCHDLKEGQVLHCGECGLKLKVVAECRECGEDVTECSCDEHCIFSCCGSEMEVVES